MTTANLPCTSVQSRAIAKAAQDHNRYLTELEATDPGGYPQLQSQGELANVTLSYNGNGWYYIQEVQAASAEDHERFADALWDEILNKAENRHQNREMIARHIQGGFGRGPNCRCASRLNAALPN